MLDVNSVDRVLEKYVPHKAYLLENLVEAPSRTTENRLKTIIYLKFIFYTLELLT